MGLLQDIEEGASGDTVPLATLLRMVMRLASRLDSKIALDWVEHELNGYPKTEAVPDYRSIGLVIKANMMDGFRQINGWTVPPHLIGDDADKWTSVDIRDGVGAIERLVGANDEGTICYVMGNLPLILNARKRLQWDVVSAWGEASRSRVGHILDTVRTRVLKLVLEIAKEFPDADTVKPSTPREVERVTQIVTNNIFGPGTIVGTATNSNVITNVLQGDHASLKQALEEAGVEPQSIDELRSALEAEPATNGTAFGPKVAGWIAKMMGKAADGSWKVATGAAGSLLARVIGRYYGIPA